MPASTTSGLETLGRSLWKTWEEPLGNCGHGYSQGYRRFMSRSALPEHHRKEKIGIEGEKRDQRKKPR